MFFNCSFFLFASYACNESGLTNQPQLQNMKQIRTLKLGVPCIDKATELEGQCTHWIMGTDEHINYLFQPKGINPETGHPVDKIHLNGARIEAPEEAYELVDVPVEVLGTQVTDDASGFTGMAISLVQHIHGCFHVQIQPSGRLPKTNSAAERADFSILQCSGEAIPKLSEKEKTEEKGKRPSPTGDSGFEAPFPDTGSSPLGTRF